jgi:hypothetical protein
MESAHHSKCACGKCHEKRVADGTQDAYMRELRAETDRVLRRPKEDNEVPLCHKCKKARAWRGECIDCYMANHSEPWVDAYGRRRFPDTHNIRQGYYMEEEHYARAHRLERERRAASKQSAEAALSSFSAAAINAGNAIVEAKAMPGGETELDFIKNLFETVQGVKYDDKCPHGDPFSACMSCSH